MPAITPLNYGTLIACYFVCRSLVSSDSRIELLRSSDGGLSWANEGGIQEPGSGEGRLAYRVPHIYTATEGRLIMTPTRFDTTAIDRTFDPESRALQRPEPVPTSLLGQASTCSALVPSRR